MTRILVTGGRGFVGAELVARLTRRGDRVRVVDLAPAPTPASENVDYRRVDITDARAVAEACQGIDTVFHTASLVHTRQSRAEAIWSVNLGGTENLLAASRAAGVRRFVYVSSASVVYEGKDIENGDERLGYAAQSQAPYADSKIAAEKAVLAANGTRGLATCAIRPHVVFGPGDQRFLPALLAHAKAGRLKFQIGSGAWLSDFTYISNLIDALLLAQAKLDLGSAVAGQPYFITNGEPIPFWEFVRKLLARLSLPPIRYRIPRALAYGLAAIKEDVTSLFGGRPAEDGLSRFAIRYMCTHHYFSIAKAERELGYRPAIRVDAGIEQTCATLQAGESRAAALAAQ
jgi:nucleoside-diphosphate-sugar epimerase